MDRDKALDLLRSQHDFPGEFEFRVVVKPPDVGVTVSAMSAAAGELARVVNVGERHSRKGTYVALAVTMHLDTAERVLDVYALVQSMDQVVTSM